jgi:hypothetical protein
LVVAEVARLALSLEGQQAVVVVVEQPEVVEEVELVA